MYDLADVAALMKSVMEDTNTGAAALRSEQPVACMQYEMDGWLNQRLVASVGRVGCGSGDRSHAGNDDSDSDMGSLSVRNTAGRLFDEPDAVHVRRTSACRETRIAICVYREAA
jgi:hypothetical protein